MREEPARPEERRERITEYGIILGLIVMAVLVALGFLGQGATRPPLVIEGGEGRPATGAADARAAGKAAQGDSAGRAQGAAPVRADK